MSKTFIVIDSSDGQEFDSLEAMAEEMDEDELEELENGDKIVVVQVDIDIKKSAKITTSHRDGRQAFCQCPQCRASD